MFKLLQRFKEKVEAAALPYGDCCQCGGVMHVRNILTLDIRAPVPGTGWGCTKCGLPNDGALAVLCDRCAKIRGGKLKEICHGRPEDKKRIPFDTYQMVPFRHNMRKHPGETQTHTDGK